MSTLSKAIYRFNAISIKISMLLFAAMEKKIKKCIWNHKNTPNSQNNLEKEEKI